MKIWYNVPKEDYSKHGSSIELNDLPINGKFEFRALVNDDGTIIQLNTDGVFKIQGTN